MERTSFDCRAGMNLKSALRNLKSAILMSHEAAGNSKRVKGHLVTFPN